MLSMRSDFTGVLKFIEIIVICCPTHYLIDLLSQRLVLEHCESSEIYEQLIHENPRFEIMNF